MPVVFEKGDMGIKAMGMVLRTFPHRVFERGGEVCDRLKV
jgi:hypothetical protein